MTRNKNNPETGKRGELPTPLVGKLFSIERRQDKLEKENAELRKQLAGKPAAEPAPAPPPPPPKSKEEEPAPAPAPKKKKSWDSMFGK